MPTMPAIFFGHGNPLNALNHNSYTETWQRIGRALPKPKAIVSISAHWYTTGTFVTAMAWPRTIHDFGGFPRELYEVQYPAPGNPDLAERVRTLLGNLTVRLDHQWGLDHGTWSLLCHAFPEANIPVIQLSIDETQPAGFHYEAGKKLAPLRDEGILVIGSGNVVHNLHAYAWGRHAVEPFDWTVRFERSIREFLSARNHRPLINYESLGSDALLAVPTPDHYLPLLYVIGLQRDTDVVTFPVEGVDGGSISMLTVHVG